MNAFANFKQKFLDELEVENPIGMIQRYNIYRVSEPQNRMIFVEGSSDYFFYSQTKNNELSHNTRYLFSVKGDYTENDRKIVGKESVLYCLGYIGKRTELARTLSRCCFIIDRDYELGLSKSKSKISDKDKKYVMVTKGHSFENYFFEETNLRKVFEECELNTEIMNEFLQHLISFLSVSVNYFAAKAAITSFFNNVNVHYKKIYGDNEIFVRKGNASDGIDKSKLLVEYNNMMDYIRPRKELMKEYSEVKKEIELNPALYIRGHNVFDYLAEYLRDNFDLQLDPKKNKTLYDKIVKKMNVNLVCLTEY